MKESEKNFEDKIKSISLFQERIKVVEGFNNEPK
jgi:hypothetical protein